MNTKSGPMIACNPQRCERIELPRHPENFGPVTIEHEPKAEPALPKAETQQNATP
jgi:hypothetical protein